MWSTPPRSPTMVGSAVAVTVSDSVLTNMAKSRPGEHGRHAALALGLELGGGHVALPGGGGGQLAGALGRGGFLRVAHGDSRHSFGGGRSGRRDRRRARGAARLRRLGRSLRLCRFAHPRLVGRRAACSIHAFHHRSFAVACLPASIGEAGGRGAAHTASESALSAFRGREDTTAGGRTGRSVGRTQAVRRSMRRTSCRAASPRGAFRQSMPSRGS